MHPITTRSADCKDCYRCLRVCPVKAISVKDGQAKVLEEKCILCGRCVLECPQKAKLIKSEVYKVRDYLSSKRVVLSIAPSFPAYFSDKDFNNIVFELKKLGFYAIEETSLGARYTAEAYKFFFDNTSHTIISSCCPVIVNLIEIYFPELISKLAPVASPMIAHGLSIKERLGWDTKVVFAGPCIAKMLERGKEGKIDAVLTFAQLEELLELGKLEEKPFELLEDYSSMETRLFPLPGGTIRSFMGNDCFLNTQVQTITGLEDCWQTLMGIKEDKINLKFIELLACREGCINGPVMDHKKSLLERRRTVLDFYGKFTEFPAKPLYPITKSLLERRFLTRTHQEEQASEETIKQILAQIGKYTKEDEKNCGGCGYPTCREKAQAVYNGHAQLEMCVSYMKTKAESTAHTIVNSTPNAIIVFDKNLRIKELNPAAKKFFQLYSLEVGDILSDYMDTDHFLKVIQTGIPLKHYTCSYAELGYETQQIVVPMAKSNDNLYMAIITDVTENERKRQEMEQIKDQILSKAQHVINNQMLVAQQIAGLLGETTAETKVTLLELIKHFNKETERDRSCN